MKLIATLALAFAFAVNASAIHLTDLRCESLVQPIGIDTAAPRFSWRLIDPQSTRGQRQTAWQIIAHSGESALWDSGKIESAESIHIEYTGKQLRSNQHVRWKVRVWDMNGNPTPWSEESTFSTGLLAPADWKGAWIAHPTAKQTEHVWFRKSFTLDDVPDHAFVHIASIGYHELYVNGARIGSEVLAPSLTNLQKRVLYVTRDIAPHLRAGKNTIALWTGAGWARADGSYGKGLWMQDTLVKCQIDMSNGISLHTDASWKCHVSSSSYRGLWKGGGKGQYGGEIIDARRHIADWNTLDYDDSTWPAAATAQKEGITLSAQMLEPDRIIETLKPVTITESNGNFTFDMGRNFTGWIELNLRNGTEGKVVRITTANRPGHLVEFDQESHYIHDASGKGTFCHRFNYQAGRWITLHNLGYRPELADIKGHIISNDVTRVGRFESSEPLFNAIYETDIRTFIANTVNGVTMDCPHRERYGYGEVQLACSWGCSIPHFLAASYWRHVSRNWADVQREDGFINTIAPQTYNGAGGTLWNSALVTLNRESYLAYNDLRQLRDVYPAMKRWAEFLHASVSVDGVLVPYDKVSRFLGDWATPHGSEFGDTPVAALFNNCVYAYNLITLVEAAHALGHPEDAGIYQQRLDALRKNAHRKFYDEQMHRYIDGRQLAMAFPLYVGITPESEREAVMAGFIEEITVRKPYLDTGSSGLPILLKFLVEHAGRADILANILARTEAPGYGHFLKNGATTWPEYWKGENDKSHIHTCYTGISGVFTRAIGGIRPDPTRPGMKHFLVQPQLVGTLTHANTTAASYYGDILCNWSRTGTTATFDITVPPNTSATFHLPAAAIDNVRESGKSVAHADGVTHLGNQDATQILRLLAGRYQFTTTSAPPPASQAKDTPPAETKPAIELGAPFGDNAVLQREMKLPVWGWSQPGTKITVKFAGQNKSTTTGDAGKWMLELDPLKADATPQEMVISDGAGYKVTLKDILVGEVWICSGQSNMQYGWGNESHPMFNWGGDASLAALVADARTKPIRSFTVLPDAAFTPSGQCKGAWSADVSGSAVAFGFSYHLYQQLKVPVGVVVTCWGSSSIEGWMPRELTGQLPHFKAIMDAFDADANVQGRVRAAMEKGIRPGNVFVRQQPNLLYNAMLHPLIPYASRGMVWYQGEANSAKPGEYAQSLPAWINRLRTEWERDDFHFLVVMLPGYNDASWPLFREAQLGVLKTPHTSVVNTIDLGDEKNIHPPDKAPICERLALLARRDVYGEKIAAQGPLLKSASVKGQQVLIEFDHADGLKTSDGAAPTGFQLAGKDRKWFPATAVIKGNKVELVADGLSEPVFVRYAFAGKPVVNLLNGANLPAYPFRSNEKDN